MLTNQAGAAVKGNDPKYELVDSAEDRPVSKALHLAVPCVVAGTNQDGNGEE